MENLSVFGSRMDQQPEMLCKTPLAYRRIARESSMDEVIEEFPQLPRLLNHIKAQIDSF